MSDAPALPAPNPLEQTLTSEKMHALARRLGALVDDVRLARYGRKPDHDVVVGGTDIVAELLQLGAQVQRLEFLLSIRTSTTLPGNVVRLFDQPTPEAPNLKA